MPTYSQSTPGLQLLDTHYQNQVAQGLIPDLFSRFVPTVQNTPQLGGALTGPTGPPAQSPTPPTLGGSGGGQGGGGSGGQGNSAQLAQAALLYQMLQGGPGGFYGRLGGGGGTTGGKGGLGRPGGTTRGNVRPEDVPGLGAGFAGLMGDPAIQALFNPGNAMNPSFPMQNPMSPQQFGQYRNMPGKFAPAPNVFQNAITALQMLLGL